MIVRRLFQTSRTLGAAPDPVTPSDPAPSEPAAPAPTACSVGAYLADTDRNNLATFTHGATLGTLATALAVGGGVAGMLLAGRPIAGALLGVGAGAAVGTYKYATWRKAGGTTGLPGACSLTAPAVP